MLFGELQFALKHRFRKNHRRYEFLFSYIETKRFASALAEMGADYDAPVSGEKSGRVKALCRLYGWRRAESL